MNYLIVTGQSGAGNSGNEPGDGTETVADQTTVDQTANDQTADDQTAEDQAAEDHPTWRSA